MCTFFRSLIRKHLANSEGYSSAGMEVQKDSSKAFLNANENPYTIDELAGYNYYPEPQPLELRKKLASLYAVSPEQLLITRGADEGIALLLRLFCEPHEDSILINPPTFGVYKAYGASIPLKETLETPLLNQNNDYQLNTKELCKVIKTKAPKLVFLTNPNNPTGGSFNKDELLSVINAAKDTSMVVVDETYIEFSEQTSFTEVMGQHPNLVILRTLSKSYALAGARIGALITHDPDMIHMLQSKVMEAYPIPRPSVSAALRMLEPETLYWAKSNITSLIRARKNMEQRLPTLPGIQTVYKSDTNFLLVKMERASEFCTFAAKNNIILRDFSNAPGTKDCLRITIGKPEDNARVIELIDQFYN